MSRRKIGVLPSPGDGSTSRQDALKRLTSDHEVRAA
jgi:hypothetical protein